MTVTAAPLTAPRRHRSALTIGIAVVALAGVPAIFYLVLKQSRRDVTQAGTEVSSGSGVRRRPIRRSRGRAVSRAARSRPATTSARDRARASAGG